MFLLRKHPRDITRHMARYRIGFFLSRCTKKTRSSCHCYEKSWIVLKIKSVSWTIIIIMVQYCILSTIQRAHYKRHHGHYFQGLTQYPHNNPKISHIWLVVYLPLWKIWKSVGIIIPNIWTVIKFMFQTTNQIYKIKYIYIYIHGISGDDWYYIYICIFTYQILFPLKISLIQKNQRSASHHNTTSSLQKFCLVGRNSKFEKFGSSPSLKKQSIYSGTPNLGNLHTMWAPQL